MIVKVRYERIININKIKVELFEAYFLTMHVTLSEVMDYISVMFNNYVLLKLLFFLILHFIL